MPVNKWLSIITCNLLKIAASKLDEYIDLGIMYTYSNKSNAYNYYECRL